MAIILDKQEETVLIRQAQAGDPEAFGRLYDFYIKKIYDFIYYKTLHKDTAEDLTSEVFTKVWKNITQFSTGSFSAWLYTIARNSVVDYYRRQKDNVNLEDCWDLSDNEDFLGRIDDNLKVETIKQAMSELKSAERELIIMRLWLDLSFAEISEQTGRSEGAVKMSFGRALDKIRNKVPLAIFILWPEIIHICKKIN